MKYLHSFYSPSPFLSSVLKLASRRRARGTFLTGVRSRSEYEDGVLCIDLFAVSIGGVDVGCTRDAEGVHCVDGVDKRGESVSLTVGAGELMVWQ